MEVYFEDEAEWFEGTVTKYEGGAEGRGWFVEYDDGDEEWEDPAQADTLAPGPEAGGRAIIHFAGYATLEQERVWQQQAYEEQQRARGGAGGSATPGPRARKRSASSSS